MEAEVAQGAIVELGQHPDRGPLVPGAPPGRVRAPGPRTGRAQRCRDDPRQRLRPVGAGQRMQLDTG
jgi:hypothetical protein